MSEGLILEDSAPVKRIGVRHFQFILQCVFYFIIYGIQFAPMPSPQVAFSFTIAFVIATLFSGLVCKKYGFKWPMVISMTVISIIHTNIPYILDAHYYWVLLFLRVVEGVFAGICFTMPADFISKWIPFQERTTLGTAVYTCDRFGMVLVLLVSSLFQSFDNRSGIFIEYGYVALLWALIMAIFGANSPEEYFQNKSDNELCYILQNRDTITSTSKIPWSQILKSTPFWAIIVAQIGSNWMLFILLGFMPVYFRIDYNFGFLCIIPLLSWILSFAISAISQILINKGKTTIGQSRKLFNSLGTFLPAIILLYLFFKPAGNRYEGIALWAFTSVATIGTICGSKLNSNDISSNYSCIVFGFASVFCAVFGAIFMFIFNPIFAYRKLIILFTAVLLIVTNLFYLKFGSGEVQEWDLYDDNSGEDSGLSKSSSYATCDEKKYLLYVRKQ